MDSTSNKPFYLQLPFLYVLFFFVNLLNFLDRGIIPGATNEINHFIEDHVDTKTPDVYLGLLQSAFIIGFMGGSVVFGHLIHSVRRFTLTGIGCGIWIAAVVASGSAYYVRSYAFLIFARVFSGVGEASLQCCIPPWIQSTAPESQRGIWLSVFYTAISVGTALGYAYSSLLAESIGWQFGFFIEALMMFPLVLFMFFISPQFPVEGLVANEDQSAPHSLTLAQECKNILNRPIFVAVSLGTAAQTATLIGLSTFGSAFVMGLGYFDSESQASAIFGLLVSLSGVIATPIGGWLVDRILSNHPSNDVDDSLQPLVAQDHEGLSGPEEGVSEGVNDADPGLNKVYSKSTVSQLQSICWLVFLMAVLGSACVCLVYFVTIKEVFLLMITLGFGLLFLCNSAMNLAVMLSVPLESKSLGIALNIICLHGLGDVPAPILVGLLKDSLAPGCIANDENDDNSNVAASDACRDDAAGLRLCMLIASLWLLWFVLWFYVAWGCCKARYFEFFPSVTNVQHLPYDAVSREDDQEDPGRSNLKEGSGGEGQHTVISSMWDINDKSTTNQTHQPQSLEPQEDLEHDKDKDKDKIPPPPKLSSRVLSKEEWPHASLSEQLQNVEKLRQLSRESGHSGGARTNSTPHTSPLPSSDANQSQSQWEEDADHSNSIAAKKKRKKQSLSKRITNKLLGRQSHSNNNDNSHGGVNDSEDVSSFMSLPLSPTTIATHSPPLLHGFDAEDMIVI